MTASPAAANAAAWLVRGCALYNASALAVFLVPGLLAAFGVAAPLPFWLWLPSLLGLYGAIVLWLSAADLGRYGAFAYWNGIIRVAFAAVCFALGFGSTMGLFIHLLAAGDLVIGGAGIVVLPRVTGRRPRQLLTNR